MSHQPYCLPALEFCFLQTSLQAVLLAELLPLLVAAVLLAAVLDAERAAAPAICRWHWLELKVSTPPSVI